MRSKRKRATSKRSQQMHSQLLATTSEKNSSRVALQPAKPAPTKSDTLKGRLQSVQSHCDLLKKENLKLTQMLQLQRKHSELSHRLRVFYNKLKNSGNKRALFEEAVCSMACFKAMIQADNESAASLAVVQFAEAVLAQEACDTDTMLEHQYQALKEDALRLLDEVHAQQLATKLPKKPRVKGLT